MRLLIVDDEPLAREGLRDLLADAKDVEIVGECGDGLSAIKMIRSLAPDVIFLDVQMPGLNGFGVVAEMPPERRPAIVFVTAYDEYALRAFDVNAVDYLLKPFGEDRLRVTLDRVRERLRAGAADDTAPRLAELLERLTNRPRYAERFVASGGGRMRIVMTDDVEWIEAADNYVCLHANGARALLRETMKSVEERLDPRRFARVHRSAIVNLARVKELSPLFNGDYTLTLQSGRTLTMSRTYRDEVFRRLG